MNFGSLEGKSVAELEEISQLIRQRILEVVSKNGGHLSSSLGAVDLIVAMHAVFDPASDPFIFDVSHQAYAHKLLTGRWDEFETLRTFDGTCGFTKPKESEFDYFVAGHSSTSISVAVGAAKAIKLKGEDRVPVVLIGDGSMSAGMVYEAMNELGDRKYPMVIIINDNEMSISRPIGAISLYLSRKMAAPWFQQIKGQVDRMLDGSDTLKYLAKRFEESLRLITPGILFEELGLDYIGPIDGHDMADLIEVLSQAKEMQKPVVVHAQTLKGKGYSEAEGAKEHWHGVAPFDPESGKPLKNGGAKNATTIFSEALLELARNDEKVVGVTAAMPSGTGLSALIDEYPDRFWDVAIAEQHAVTSSAALAKEGFKPFCAIYSTFLQRGFDQIIHDVAIDNLPVIFAIDRAGVVGEDGETHHGVFDISFLRTVPNIVIFAPRDEESLRDSVRFAASLNKPVAFRYPRGAFATHTKADFAPFELGKSQWLKDDGDHLIIGYGNGAAKALAVADQLMISGIRASVLDLRFVKPLDIDAIQKAGRDYKKWALISESAKAGGVGSALLEALNDYKISGVEIEVFEYEDRFITHGTMQQLDEITNMSVDKITKRLVDCWKR